MSCFSSVYNIPVICKLKWLRNQDVELDFREPLSGNPTLFSVLIVLYRVIPLSVDLKGAVECLEVTSVESGLLVTWRNLWGQQDRHGLTFHRKQGSTLVLAPLAGSDVGTSYPAIVHAALCQVLGERIDAMRYMGPSLPVGSPYGMIRRSKEMSVPFLAFYQGSGAWGWAPWGVAPATGYRGHTFVREKAPTCCWCEPQMGSWGPRYGFMGTEDLANICHCLNKNKLIYWHYLSLLVTYLLSVNPCLSLQ